MSPAAELLIREHRRLDELFGRLLGAVHGSDADAATGAAREFDAELRRHTRYEEEHVLGARPKILAPLPDESPADRRSRELVLEHVQIREVSGMIASLLERSADLEGARRLAANLALRWDAHTRREEEDLFPTLS